MHINYYIFKLYLEAYCANITKFELNEFIFNFIPINAKWMFIFTIYDTMSQGHNLIEF